MPSFTVKIPVSHGPANFARRARVKAGLGAMYVRSQTVFPGPNIFKGLASFFINGTTSFPQQNVFTPYARRGVGVFRAQVSPTPIFPGRNVFTPFIRGNCASCPTPCAKAKYRRAGMGQNDEFSALVSQGMTNAGDFSSTLAPLEETTSLTPPTFSLPSYASYGGGVVNPNEIGSYQNLSAIPSSSTAAYNQALTNAAANNPSLLNSSTLTQLSNALAKASPTQVSQATQQLSTSSSVGTQLSTFLSQYGTYLLLGGAGIFAVSLLTKKKGR